MSRGLSQQQRLILGLAVAMSRHHYGSPKAHIPQTDPGWRIPVAFTANLPDVTTALATHIVHGVTIEHYKHSVAKTYTNGVFALTPETKSAKNSASRAITILMKRGLLVYRPHRRGESLQDFEWGYLLTPTGLESGRQHEINLPADINHRLVALGWLVVRRRLGCGAWGYDKAIPLTFRHPKVLALTEFGLAPTDTSASGKRCRGSSRGPRQQIDHAQVLSVDDGSIGASPTDNSDDERDKCLRGSDREPNQHIDHGERVSA